MSHDLMRRPKTEFDVILTTHNHIELTIECLNCLYRHTSIPFGLIVIDDSTDLTPQWFDTFQKSHDNVKFIRPSESLVNGNQCFRLGAEQSNSEFVVSLVNSARVEPEWYNTPLQLLQQNPKVGLVGIKLLSPNGIIWHAGIGFNNHIPFHIGSGAPGHQFSHIRPALCVNYSVGFFRRQALLDSLDEKTYIGWRSFEDTDVCVSLRDKGWSIMYCGMASAYHIESPTRLEGDQMQFWKEYNENLRRFIAKWQMRDELFR